MSINEDSAVAKSSESVRRATKPDVYGPLRRTLPIGDLMRKLIMRAPMARITETLVSAKSHTVLDVGCGTGVLANKLSKLGLQVTGIDVSRTMIQRARKVASRVELRWQDTTTMTHERVFDAAIVSMALHEMGPEARIQTWVNTMQAVKTGGFVLVLDFIEPVTDSIFTRFVRAQIERDERAFDRFNPNHYTNFRQFMTAGGLREWLRSVDAIVDIERNFLGTNLGLSVVRVIGRTHEYDFFRRSIRKR